MKNEIHKKMLHFQTMFPDEAIKYHDAVNASNGNTYIAFHNIMRTCHPHLIETEIETKIPTQRNAHTFGTCMCNTMNFFSREKLRR